MCPQSTIRPPFSFNSKTMSVVIANQVSGIDAVKLVQEGKKLQCPVCAAIIQTIPEKWMPGMPLHGIECPNGQNHFMIHCEDEHAMKEMRARMKVRSGKK